MTRDERQSEARALGQRLGCSSRPPCADRNDCPLIDAAGFCPVDRLTLDQLARMQRAGTLPARRSR